MSKAPAFQFYPNDWLSSTNIMLMTPAEEGAYIRLLAISWNNENCDLPNDDEQLAVLSRLGEGWFNGSSTKIRKCFKVKGNRLVNERLQAERKKQDEWREKSRQGGIKSGKVRNNNDLNNEGSLKGGSNLVEPKGNSSSSSSSSIKRKKNNKKERSDFVFILPEEIDQKTWDAFVEMRKSIKKPLTEYAKHLIVLDLNKLSGDKNAILNQSIKKSWQGVFPLTDGDTAKSTYGLTAKDEEHIAEIERRESERP